MNTYLVATRLGYNDIAELINSRVGRLNQKMAKSVRQAVMDNGIKQTVKGARLEFYPVDADQLESLKKDPRILAAIDRDKFSETVSTINADPRYCRRMKPALYREYSKDLRDALAAIVEKINDEAAPAKQAHGLEVGDWVRVPSNYRSHNARVTRVNAKTVWYEVALVPNLKSYVQNVNINDFKNASLQGRYVTVPYAGNEHEFKFCPHAMSRKISKANIVEPSFNESLYCMYSD